MTDPRRFDWLFRARERDEDLPLSAEARFAEAFAQLPAAERSALALRQIGGLDDDEIAARLGTETAVASALVARARASLRTALADRAHLLSTLALQHCWLGGGAALRVAGAVAVIVLGIGATFDSSTVDPPSLAPPRAGELRVGDVRRVQAEPPLLRGGLCNREERGPAEGRLGRRHAWFDRCRDDRLFAAD